MANQSSFIGPGGGNAGRRPALPAGLFNPNPQANNNIQGSKRFRVNINSEPVPGVTPTLTRTRTKTQSVTK